MAKVYRQLGQWKERDAILDRAITAYDNLARGLQGQIAQDLGQELQFSGRHAASTRIFPPEKVLPNDNMWSSHIKAYRFLNLGELDTCVAEITRLLERFPAFHHGYALLARARYQQGNLELADRAIHQALAILPRNPGLLTWHGRILARQGRLDEAFARFTMAKAMNSGFLSSRSWALPFARQHQRTGDYLRFARDLWRSPHHPGWAGKMMVRVLLEQNHLSLALDTLEATLEKNRKGARGQLDLILFAIDLDHPQLRPGTEHKAQAHFIFEEMAGSLVAPSHRARGLWPEWLEQVKGAQILSPEHLQWFEAHGPQERHASSPSTPSLPQWMDPLWFPAAVEAWAPLSLSAFPASLPMPESAFFPRPLPTLKAKPSDGRRLQAILEKGQDQWPDLPLLDVQKWLERWEPPAPGQRPKNLDAYLKTHPKVHANWDFPPRVYLERKARQKARSAQGNP